MKYLDPINTQAWVELKKHFEQIKNVHIKDLFYNDSNRFEKFSINFDNQLLVDFSKNRITSETVNKLLQLANEMKLKSSIQSMFNGEKINYTENQPVLHVALRNQIDKKMIVHGENIMSCINKSLKKMQIFSELVINKIWIGFSNKNITDIVNIGIGGSDLGPHMVYDALTPYRNYLKVHYVSNIDGSHLLNVLKKVNPETTLFIVVSKTFTTQETMINANSACNWLLKYAKHKKFISKHFCAVTMNIQKAKSFGIDEQNIFELWDWVGGRYSLWSSVGISIMLSIGFKNFMKLLEGGHAMDRHFLETDFKKNIPVLLALISVWYNNFFRMETEAILPYDQYLHRLPEYLQQANMESNGKCVNRNGKLVTWQTGPIIWGKSGTNGQHAFYQLMHQGTKIIPCDFIAAINSHNELDDHHKILLSHFFAQTKALAFGTNSDIIFNDFKNDIEFKNHALPFKVFLGNRPTNSILLKKVTPYTLGLLLALYEHKIFTQGVIFNIFSFDQWGVELGKILSKKIFVKLNKTLNISSYDSSTENLISYYKQWKE
ncbi:glucose-6-phosphate isomerase [Buchnera aphidicola (Nipponaphis monzeni)]|uniref:Glucose-6-phosphate isomerase n=1 Tax=Buchnera aphidicola (Nipponaphis monzeni) TaxID=2495405 RepID=A0A455TAS1_9GAMM|nr:glucose-6-phosphate isomerase [Buchnera aphidicola]BBI01433.1 glucose-6-phosphate isomerase [Buchnera aphidicola (Nipponaphis monzeni)]